MSRESHAPFKQKKLNKLAKSLPAVSELRTGLTLVVGHYGELIHLVHYVMVKELSMAAANLPVPMPDCSSVLCVQSGPLRQLEQLHGLRVQLGFSAPPFEKCQFVDRVASCALDWTNPASVSIVCRLNIVKDGGCVVLQQPAGQNPDFEGLLHLRRAAEKYKARIILFCPAVADEAKFSGVANELFVAAPCEPNPGFDEGFVVSCPELASPLSPASGKVLCCVRLGEDGLKTEITPFVADDLKTRLMAILKADEWSLEKIGKLVGLNKSNVSRKLRMVSGAVPDDWDDAMLDEWIEACDLDPIDDDSDDDDDGDEGDDLNDLDRANPVAPVGRNERNTRNKAGLTLRKQR
ncbi:hypothetical protein KW843_07285 [Acidovorax sp. sif1233]|uniref:hypothetical protein n=1 Tax=Acidovorax sp. sif1233 TaxID=2854792 RepID=UPI001C47D832|nr:hypothetical protein [Acidovorax sp. sif1233]MBV7454269.1 hypothetical protein [Acidovorax sp. sif1233]